MDAMRLLPLVIVTTTAAVQGASAVVNNTDLTLTLPQTLHTTLYTYQTYNISVNTSDSKYQYPTFSLQVHTQLYNVSLTNASHYCLTTCDIDCTVYGSNVGLVQGWNEDVSVFSFHVRVECVQGQCLSGSSKPVPVLLAVIGVPVDDPIPGGCALTSNLIIDPNLSITYTSYSTEVKFEDSDVGFRPSYHHYNICDIGTTYPLQQLEYTVYQKCLGSQQFSVSAMFDAIEDMLTVSLTDEQESSYSNLQSNDVKKIKFNSIAGQGVVYNVIVTDKVTGDKSAYVPAVTYACDLYSDDTQSCRGDIPAINIVIGIILLVMGLALCLVGHTFFHGEVIVFHFLGGSFLWFTLLSIVTSLDTHLLGGLALLGGALYCLVWFLFWFLTGWHWFQVIVFGLYGDFIIISSVLYSPIEDVSVFTVLQISYVYCLTIICGMILLMVPLVAFPRAMNIWVSSLVGGYTFIMGVGMFTYTELSEIVLLVVKKLSIPDFYTAHIDCPLLTTDYILIAVWAFLLVLGITMQTVIVQLKKRKHDIRQAHLKKNARKKFNSFPHPSLLKKLLQYRMRKINSPEDEPLLTPRGHGSPPHSQWSPVHSTRLPSNGRWSPDNSSEYHGSYGTIGKPVRVNY